MTCINYTLHTLYSLTPLNPPRVSQILINSTLTLHYYTLSLSPSSPALLGLVPPLKAWVDDIDGLQEATWWPLLHLVAYGA